MQENFETLYSEFVEKIYRFFYYRLGNKEISEDLTSQTFLKALDKFETFNPKKGSFSPWVYTIARNNLIDYYRRNKTHIDIESVLGLAEDSDLVKDVDLKNRLRKVKDYLEELSDDQKSVVLLRVWDDLSFDEIAEIIGKREDNCRVIFSRALSKIKEEFPQLLLLLTIFKHIN